MSRNVQPTEDIVASAIWAPLHLNSRYIKVKVHVNPLRERPQNIKFESRKNLKNGLALGRRETLLILKKQM